MKCDGKNYASSHCVGVDRRRKTCFLNSVFSNFHIEKWNKSKTKAQKSEGFYTRIQK